MTRVFGMLSMVVSIGAGLYLIGSQTAAPNSYLEVIAHGMGVYFIAKGLFMGPSLFQQAGYAELLESLREYEAENNGERTRTHKPE